MKNDDATTALDALVIPVQGGRLTSLGCPDCRGVLAVSVLGNHTYLRFSCQVGHVFSDETLLARKDTELEESLWSSAETALELVQLYKVLADRAQQGGCAEEAAAFGARSAAAEKDVTQIRRLIEGVETIDPEES